MRLVFLSDNMNFSGGRKLLFDYAIYLRSVGHEVDVLVQRRKGGLKDYLPVTVVPDYSAANIPDCDLVVAMTPREVAQAWKAAPDRVVHFCQGFEITDLAQRLTGEVLPPRFQGRGLWHSLRLARKKLSWRRKLARIDRVYRFPTRLITVSKHLKDELERRYGRPVALVVNGIDNGRFFPDPEWIHEEFGPSRLLRVINIGPKDVTFKGIDTTFKAIESAKNDGLPIEFIRVSPKPMAGEKDDPLVDVFHESLTQDELGEAIRRADVYISNSTEGEGFGLPAMEALSCGAVCVLSSISSYKNFAAERSDYCLFVNEGDATGTVAALKKIINMSPADFAAIRAAAIEVSVDYAMDKACARFEKTLKDILTEIES